MVSFDFEPPLQHVGADAKRRNWVAAFAAYERPLGYEIHDLTIAVGDEVAFTHSLNRISGTLKNGSRTDFWLRATTGLRKIDGNWLITHDQVSVPLDFESRHGAAQSHALTARMAASAARSVASLAPRASRESRGTARGCLAR